MNSIKTHIRIYYQNETCMTGSLGLTYGFGEVQLTSILQFPLSCLNKRETALSTVNHEVSFDRERRNVRHVQQPGSFRLIVVYAQSDPEDH